MAINPTTPTLLKDIDASFPAGMNSMSDPESVVPGMVCRAMNSVNRGGIYQCRPG